MDYSEAIKIASEFAKEVNRKYQCSEVILFGSYAKGTNHKDSDIDIAVIFDQLENTLDMQLKLMRLRRKIDSRIEPHPFSIEDFNNTNPLVYEINKFGQSVNFSQVA